MKVMATGTFDILHPGHGVYLEESKKLGGEDAELYVVVARDATVKRRKRVPTVGEDQRLELIKMLKPVDDAFLGDANGDVFKIVREIDPDIITVGADQDYDIDRLQEAINKRGLKAKAVRIEKYRDCELDSSCKIIRKIQNTNYEGKIMDHCDD